MPHQHTTTPNRRSGPQHVPPRFAGRRIARVLVVLTACLIQAVLGVTVSASGLIMPTGAVMLLGLVWIAGVGVMILNRRHPALVLAVPIASWIMWFTVVWIGDTWLGWVA